MLISSITVNRYAFKANGLIIVISLVAILMSIAANGQQKAYVPAGLRKLSQDELVQRLMADRLLNESLILKDSAGVVIPLSQLALLPQDNYTVDQYVDGTGDVIELVIRRATAEDRAFMRKMEGLVKAKMEGEPITVVDIDCNDVKKILEEVFEKDQRGRSTGNFENDKQNQQIVVSVLEKCGFPTIEGHGSTSVQAVFLVIQHAGKNLRTKYFPLIQQAVKRGDLQASVVALMEDRMLMDEGRNQKYGTQVVKKFGSEKWELHPIEDAGNVNQRRAAVGLGPIEDYLLNFDIVYDQK